MPAQFNQISLGIKVQTLIETEVSHQSLVEKFVRFLCEELDVKPSKVTIASYEHKECLGSCIDETETDFLILVNEKDRDIGEIFTTIAHEMIHVKQYMKENLGWFLDNHYGIPYMDRWWEKEAFTNAVPLVEKFAKGLNNERNDLK